MVFNNQNPVFSHCIASLPFLLDNQQFWPGQKEMALDVFISLKSDFSHLLFATLAHCAPTLIHASTIKITIHIS